MIIYQTDGVKMPQIKRRATTRWIQHVASCYDKAIGEIAYIFCSDQRILEVNRQYLGHDYYTDIITFDYCDGNKLHGDIFISLDTVASNAQKYGTDPQNELHRVIIHGILHLCGIDDKGEGQRAFMQKAEDEALALLSEFQASKKH